MKNYFVIYIFIVLSIALNAQENKLLSLRKLSKQPLYVLYDTTNFKEYEFKDFVTSIYRFDGVYLAGNEIKILSINDLKRNENVIRLYLKGNYYDSISFSKLDFPNLQELIIRDFCVFPNDIDKFKKLQILDVNHLGEVCTCYEYGNKPIKKIDSLGYKYPFFFPKQILNLTNLKILSYTDYEGGCIPYLPNISSLKKIKYFRYIPSEDFNQSLYVNASILQKKNVKIDNTLHLYVFIINHLPKSIYKNYNKLLITQIKSNGKYYVLKKIKFKKYKYKGNLSKGKPNGKWLIWHSNGVLAQEQFYKNGIEDSVWTIWDTIGKLNKQIYFTKGVIDSIVQFPYGTTDFIITTSNIKNYSNRIEQSRIYKDSLFLGGQEFFYENNTKIYVLDTRNILKKEDERISYLKEIYNFDGKIIEYYDSNNLLFEKKIVKYNSIKKQIIEYNEKGEIIKTYIE